MANLLALEWDATEARVAVARTHGKEATIEHAFAVPLTDRAEGEESVGQKIAATLKSRGIGRAETLVAVGRASIELRQMSLPPAPSEEMPELVRFQAMRQFTTISEDWPLDFVPLTTADADTASALVAAISPELVAQINATCLAAELTMKRLVLRPFAAASLLRRADQDAEQPCRMMVDMLTEEADITVLDEQQVLLMRTVRLGSADDGEAQAKSLLGEIRRTIAAASNQLHGRRVERVVLCGDSSDQMTLKKSIEDELSLTVDLFDPFAHRDLGKSLQIRHPDYPGRFAPLIGMLLDESAGATHAIDFLHPRQKPEPLNTRRRNSLIAVSLAVTVLAAALLVWWQLGELDDEIAQTRSQINGLKSKVSKAEQQKKDAASVQSFLDSDINWLTELERLAQQLPPADDVIATQMNLGTRLPSGGEIQIDGYARQLDQVKKLESRLREGGRTVISKGGQEDPRRTKEKHRWSFDETVLIEPASSNVAKSNAK